LRGILLQGRTERHAGHAAVAEIVSERELSLYAVARPSVVCLSVVFNVRAPYSAGRNLGNVSTPFGILAIP